MYLRTNLDAAAPMRTAKIIKTYAKKCILNLYGPILPDKPNIVYDSINNRPYFDRSALTTVLSFIDPAAIAYKISPE
jgi:hypothetical protein